MTRSVAWPPGSDRPIRFDQFIEAALYDPTRGFYGSGAGRAGRRGDFLTSVEIGPLFGAVLARAIDAWWDELGRPDPYTVVDAGAGVGTLARTLGLAAPRCAEALVLVLVERSASSRSSHPRGLACGAEVRSLAKLPDEPMDGVIVANELLDNLPFRLLERTVEGWLEVWVGPDGEELRPAPEAPPFDAPIGSRAPYQAAAAAWVSTALGRLRGGRLVVLDYADSTANLALREPTTWLRTYREHSRGHDPYADVGGQDITCEVALDQLPAGAAVSTQADFLRRWGIAELVAEGQRIWQARAHLGDLAAWRARSRVREAEALLDPAGLGAFVVAEWQVPGPGPSNAGPPAGAATPGEEVRPPRRHAPGA